MPMCLKSQAQLDGTRGLAVASCRLQLVRSQEFLFVLSLISFKSHIFQTCIFVELGLTWLTWFWCLN